MLSSGFRAGAFLLALFMFAVPPVSTQASPEIFERLSGKWRGQGLVKAAAAGKQESIRCRMSNKAKNTEGRLDMSGNCAVSGFVFSLNGYIQQNGGKNSYTASLFRSLTTLDQSGFSGKRNGNRISFRFKAFDRLTKTNVSANIQLIARSTDAFDVKISRTDPKSGKVFDVGTIKFAKRG